MDDYFDRQADSSEPTTALPTGNENPMPVRPESSYEGYGAQQPYGGAAASGSTGSYGTSGSGSTGTYGTSGSGNAGYYSNDGYGTGRTGYSSAYDHYRYSSPYDPNPVTADQMAHPGTGQKAGESHSTAKKIGVAAAIAAVFGLVAGLVFMLVTTVSGVFSAGQKTEIPTAPPIQQAAPTPTVIIGSQAAPDIRVAPAVGSAEGEMTTAEVAAYAMPSMVSITNTSVEEYYDFFGNTTRRDSVSAGSGIIIGQTDSQVLIATNNHVIERSSEITVTFVDDAAVSGVIKGTDAENDLAVIGVDLADIPEETREEIRVIAMGDSNACVVGEPVVAIGNALGYGLSVSHGIVSALNRPVEVDGVTHELLQTDASINPGNSGGALLNMRGELIGINEIKYVDAKVEGVGYAIPIATAQPILQSISNRAARQKVPEDQAAYLGIKCMGVPSYYVQSGYPSGVYISEVTPGGPADQAGIKAGDIVTSMDGSSVATSDQLVQYLAYYAAGETIEFGVARLNEEENSFEVTKVSVTLGRKADSELAGSGNTESAPAEENAGD